MRGDGPREKLKNVVRDSSRSCSDARTYIIHYTHGGDGTQKYNIIHARIHGRRALGSGSANDKVFRTAEFPRRARVNLETSRRPAIYARHAVRRGGRAYGF